MRVLVLHNPSAGDGRPPADDLLRLLREVGFDPAYASTKDAGFAAAMEAPADLVIAAGGDGTVAKVAANLPDRRRPIAILPLGGANNVARSLGIGIGGDLARLIAALPGAPARRLDLAAARGPWGTRLVVEGVGLGALARSSADAGDPGPADKIRVGREALRRAVANEPAVPFRLILDGDAFAGEFLMVEAVNLRTTGPALALAPHTDPGDGCLDLICIGAEHRQAMLAWLERPDAGNPPPGELRRCRRLAFAWRDVPLRLDDDLPEPPTTPADVEVEVEPEPLRVLVPAAAPPGRPAAPT